MPFTLSILLLSILIIFISLYFQFYFYNESMYEGGQKIGLHGLCSEDNDCSSNNCVEGRCVKYHGCI